MKPTLGTLFTVALAGTLAGCGQISAEPIVDKAGLIVGDPTTDNGLADPYACKVVQIDADTKSAEGPIPLTSFYYQGPSNGHTDAPGGVGYAAACKQTQNACRYAADDGCTWPSCGAHFDASTGLVMGGWSAVCLYECDTSADCPSPSSGTAHSTCRSWEAPARGWCKLYCDDRETCPDGFQCIHQQGNECDSLGNCSPHRDECVEHRLFAFEPPVVP